MAQSADELYELLNDKEKVFAEDYLIHLNKSKAAKKSGCPANSSREQGYQIYNREHVKAYIEARLRERVTSADEAMKLVSDTALASLTDYFVKVKKVKSQKIKVPLKKIIDDLQDEIDFEDEYLLNVNLNDKELKRHEAMQERRRRQKIRYKLELKRNPKAYRIIDGPNDLVDDVELDLVKLMADKDRIKIKKLAYDRFGKPIVETGDADWAQELILRMAGKLAADKKKGGDITFHLNMTDEEARKIKKALDEEI